MKTVLPEIYIYGSSVKMIILIELVIMSGRLLIAV